MVKQFINQINNSDYSKEELRERLLLICESFYDTLIHISAQYELLEQNPNLHFYKILDNKLDRPPFEKEFFEAGDL